eukprot:Skav220455  [mRNA]  locus=scaffold254:253650:269864:- [translate_table: standard]
MDGPGTAAMVSDIMEGIREEMLAVMSRHLRQTAVACDVYAATGLRASLLEELSQHLEATGQIGSSPPTPREEEPQMDTKCVGVKEIDDLAVMRG